MTACVTTDNDPPEAMSPYRERAWLERVLVALFGGVLSYSDEETPGWPVLYVETPEGQLSWHVSPEDLDVFDGVPVVDDYPWDEHSTEEKYERIARLTTSLPKMTYANPVYGDP